MGKPLLLMDIDGPLNPNAGQWVDHADQCARNGFAITTVGANGQHKVRYGLDHGERLRALSRFYVPVWASAWNEDSDRLYGPLIGLTGLPHIEFPDGAMEYSVGREHWKCYYIADLVKTVGAPGLLWFDDEVTVRDQKYLTDALPGVKVKVLRVPAHEGLREHHFEEITQWAWENFD